MVSPRLTSETRGRSSFRFSGDPTSPLLDDGPGPRTLRLSPWMMRATTAASAGAFWSVSPGDSGGHPVSAIPPGLLASGFFERIIFLRWHWTWGDKEKDKVRWTFDQVIWPSSDWQNSFQRDGSKPPSFLAPAPWKRSTRTRAFIPCRVWTAGHPLQHPALTLRRHPSRSPTLTSCQVLKLPVPLRGGSLLSRDNSAGPGACRAAFTHPASPRLRHAYRAHAPA